MTITDIARTDAASQGLAVADREEAASALAHVLGTGDLYQLTNEQRVAHYLNLCQSLGLNPLSRPFQWIEFKEGENAPPVLTLYFKPSGAAQLLRNHQISVHFPRKEIVGELFVCEAHGQAPNGRTGQATKYVALTGKFGKLSGNRLATAFMSAESGALRRLALNMFGLSTGPDPDELSAVKVVTVDGTGQILEAPTEEQKALAADPRMARIVGEPVFEDVAVEESDLPSQAVRPEEMERPARPDGPRPTFGPSEEDVKRYLGAWFAAVDGLSLDTDEARHRFVAAWTADEWPKNKRTDSLRTAFARMTASEVTDFLAHVRALMEDERQEVLNWRDADGNEGGADVGLTPEQAHAEAVIQGAVVPPKATRRHPDQRVHDSVLLTGGPGVADRQGELDDQADDSVAF